LKTSSSSSVSESHQRRLAALQHRIGYVFSDLDILTLALTHRSADAQHNERLEFLGDGLLTSVIADALYRRFPGVDEGTLSRMRASLVKGETLSELAREIALGDCIRLGQGERASGGRHRDSILADALEAVIGALYLDGGFENTKACILHLLDERLDQLSPALSKDAKTRLQEWLQARGMSLPVYSLVSEGGTEHAPMFHVHCKIMAGERSYSGTGTSRRKAEQAAAAKALEDLEIDGR